MSLHFFAGLVLATALGTTPKTEPLKVVSPRDTCAGLGREMARYGAGSGMDKVQTAMLASAGSAMLAMELRNGEAQPYVNAEALASLVRGPANIRRVNAAKAGFVPLSALLAPTLGLDRQISLVLSTSELKQMPFAQRGIDVLVIAREAAELNAERVRKVADTALGLGVRVSVLWAGTKAGIQGEGTEDARLFAWLATVTGGAFADLGGPVNPCAAQL